MTKTAILVDGGFYRKRARKLWGIKTPEERANELNAYVFKHLNKRDGNSKRELYRIFYYDCPPVQSTVYHPLLKQNINFRQARNLRMDTRLLQCPKNKKKSCLALGETI